MPKILTSTGDLHRPTLESNYAVFTLQLMIDKALEERIQLVVIVSD